MTASAPLLRLHGSLTSPFVRKVRVALAEHGAAYDFVPGPPRDAGSNAERLSPLRKVPIAETAEGLVLWDSRVILEWLEARAGSRLVPREEPLRWEVLRWQALADGLMDATILAWMERARADAPHADVLAWEEARIERVLAAIEAQARAGEWLAGGRLTLADVAIAVALEYIDLRLGRAWRDAHPGLVAWLAPVGERASFVATRPPA